MTEQNIQHLVQELQIALEATTIFTVPPHYERWEDGFKSLDVARKTLSALKVKLEHARSSPVWIYGDLARVHGRLNDFVRLRDDFYEQFPNGGDSHNWHSRAAAERNLSELQRDVDSLKNNIRSHVVNPQSRDESHTLQLIVAFSFGVIFVIALIILAVMFPNPTPFQYTVFRVVLAVAIAGVTAMIPGFLRVTVSNWIRAGGALAVFVLVYFYNPAALVQPMPPTPDLGTSKSNSLISPPLQTAIPLIGKTNVSIELLAGQNKTSLLKLYETMLIKDGYTKISTRSLNDDTRPVGFEVRYYNANDQSEAENVAKIIGQNVPSKMPYSKKEQGYIEVWLGRQSASITARSKP